MSITRDFDLSEEYAQAVVLLASLLHDLGMSVHRHGHEEYSLFLANSLLREALSFLPTVERTILISETLHAIISHRSDGRPLTIEAGIVRVADALDMTEGRSRIPYELGKVDIHSVSAMAIDEIEIREGKKKPVQINIIMNHTAGIFQVDELLKKKVVGSGIEKYLDIKIFIDKGDGKQLFKDFYESKIED
jgi:metal-dependent HD superfamily phosphatase/phosphodiesterase